MSKVLIDLRKSSFLSECFVKGSSSSFCRLENLRWSRLRKRRAIILSDRRETARLVGLWLCAIVGRGRCSKGWRRYGRLRRRCLRIDTRHGSRWCAEARRRCHVAGVTDMVKDNGRLNVPSGSGFYEDSTPGTVEQANRIAKGRGDSPKQK